MDELTASVSEGAFRLLKEGDGSISLSDLCLFPEMGQIVSEQQQFDLVLAREQKKVFRQCLGQFSPDYYLAVGQVLDSRLDSTYKVDCGFPLNVSTRYFRSSAKKADRIQNGVWIAAIGRLHHTPSEDIESPETVRYTPDEAFILNMQPDSNTFGSIIPWPFGKRLPYDPDVISFSTVFTRFKALW